MSAEHSDHCGEVGQGTRLLLELLVDGVKSIFDGNATHVASCDLETQGPYEVDPLDRGSSEVLLQDVLVVDAVG